MHVDDIDRRILAELQVDGRLTVTELADRVRLTAAPCHRLLRVVATDLDDYAALRDHKLATMPGVQRITSTIVMKRIVDNRPLPLPGTRSRTARGAAATPDRQRTSAPGRRT